MGSGGSGGFVAVRRLKRGQLKVEASLASSRCSLGTEG